MALRLVCLVVLLKLASSGYLEATEGDSVDFWSTPGCEVGEDARLVHAGLGTVVASRLPDGVWQPDPLYADRMDGGPVGPVMREANINDEGVYELTCNGQWKEVVLELKVIPLIDLELVEERRPATLPCWSVTAGFPDAFPLWLRNGEPVFRTDPNTGDRTFGGGFEDRVSVAADWRRRGDLSLTIHATRQSDSGVYLCKGSRTPVAVRLEVASPMPPTHTSPPQTCPQWTQTTWALTGGALGVLVVLFVVCGLLLRKLHIRGHGGHRGPDPTPMGNGHANKEEIPLQP